MVPLAVWGMRRRQADTAPSSRSGRAYVSLAGSGVLTCEGIELAPASRHVVSMIWGLCRQFSRLKPCSLTDAGRIVLAAAGN